MSPEFVLFPLRRDGAFSGPVSRLNCRALPANCPIIIRSCQLVILPPPEWFLLAKRIRFKKLSHFRQKKFRDVLYGTPRIFLFYMIGHLSTVPSARVMV